MSPVARVLWVSTEVTPWDGSLRPSPTLLVLPGPGPGLVEVTPFPDCQSYLVPQLPSQGDFSLSQA